jgi:hypothetical protein
MGKRACLPSPARHEHYDPHKLLALSVGQQAGRGETPWRDRVTPLQRDTLTTPLPPSSAPLAPISRSPPTLKRTDKPCRHRAAPRGPGACVSIGEPKWIGRWRGSKTGCPGRTHTQAVAQLWHLLTDPSPLPHPHAPPLTPSYATPLEAKAHGPREALIYVPAIVADGSRPDYLATVDVDEGSATYGQVGVGWGAQTLPKWMQLDFTNTTPHTAPPPGHPPPADCCRR